MKEIAEANQGQVQEDEDNVEQEIAHSVRQQRQKAEELTKNFQEARRQQHHSSADRSTAAQDMDAVQDSMLKLLARAQQKASDAAQTSLQNGEGGVIQEQKRRLLLSSSCNNRALTSGTF